MILGKSEIIIDYVPKKQLMPFTTRVRTVHCLLKFPFSPPAFWVGGWGFLVAG